MDKQVESVIGSLDAICRRQIVLHDELAELLDRKREALKAADTDRMAELCGLENERVQKIAELEKRRLEVVARLTQRVRPESPEPMRMGELAMCFAGPTRDRLIALREELVGRVQAVQARAQRARSATESLLRHVTGVVQQAGAVATGVQTYGRTGHRPRSAMSIGTFQMTA
ncbi:MAG: flagellar protein FlgN [Planctomycetota bacterium]